MNYVVPMLTRGNLKSANYSKTSIKSRIDMNAFDFFEIPGNFQHVC